MLFAFLECRLKLGANELSCRLRLLPEYRLILLIWSTVELEVVEISQLLGGNLFRA